MEKRLISITVIMVVFTVLFGLIATAQATYTIYGQVFDTDGTTPVVGADVNITDINTGDSLSTPTIEGGWYQVVFGFPGTPHEVEIGDPLQFIVTYGSKRNTTVEPATGSGQTVDLILQGLGSESPTPAITYGGDAGRVRPTATPTLAPLAPTPTPPVVKTTPTIPPTPKPGIQGFEAVFAIAGLLAVAYLVLRKKQK